MYRAGARDVFVYEGSLELTPYYQTVVDELRPLSPRFFLALAWSALLLSVFWWLSPMSPWPQAYAFLLGAMVLVELTIHVRHARNLVLFRAARNRAGVSGRVEYGRATILRLSATELLAFAGLYLVVSAATGSWFVLGGTAGCLSLARNHFALARKHSLKMRNAAQQLADANKAPPG
jgi:hypothetical protein